MQVSACFLSIMFLLNAACAQEIRFLPLRYNENYTELKDTSLGNWYKKMKFFPLNKKADVYLSQGGEVRYLYQYYINEDWGDVPVPRYSSFYTRFLYHVDVHLSTYFRLFTQLNSTFATGRVTPNRPVDQNVLDIQQIFFDVNLDKEIFIRVGRQELLYGSQRLIAVREGPNNRQSYDAVKFVAGKKNIRLDLFYSHPVSVKPGMFDDRFNKREKLWSGYIVIREVPLMHNVDLYYIGYYNRNKRYASGEGKEIRHSFGTRIWHNSGSWKYDFEALYQSGKFGTQSISAYTASLDLNYTFMQVDFKPALGLKTEIISGDKSKNDMGLNTFNPLFPRGAYFGLAALIGPSNLIDFHPSFSVEPLKQITVSADHDMFWRHSLNDGIYGPNGALIYNSNSQSKQIGNQTGLSVEYRPNPFLQVTAECMWFWPGKYLTDVSPGKDLFFAACTIQFKF